MDEYDIEFEFEVDESSFRINGCDEPETEEVLRSCIFTAVIRDVITDVVYKAYVDRYSVVGNQPGGETGAGKIVVEKAPPDGCPAEEGEFSFDISRDCEGFQQAAKVIAVGLAVNKPLDLYLSLTDYGSEAINDFLQTLLSHL